MRKATWTEKLNNSDVGDVVPSTARLATPKCTKFVNLKETYLQMEVWLEYYHWWEVSGKVLTLSRRKGSLMTLIEQKKNPRTKLNKEPKKNLI